MDVTGQLIEGIWNDPTTRLVCCYLPIIGIAIFAAIAFFRRMGEKQRAGTVLAHKEGWGEDICQTIISKRINPDMTEEMVLLAWGKPNKVETKELTRQGQKTRWIYGQPRKGANYVWFTNGVVTRIQK
jgi:hypothetical protein